MFHSKRGEQRCRQEPIRSSLCRENLSLFRAVAKRVWESRQLVTTSWLGRGGECSRHCEGFEVGESALRCTCSLRALPDSTSRDRKNCIASINDRLRRWRCRKCRSSDNRIRFWILNFAVDIPSKINESARIVRPLEFANPMRLFTTSYITLSSNWVLWWIYIVPCNQIQIMYTTVKLCLIVLSSREISPVICTIYENAVGTFNITFSMFKEFG